MQYSPQISFKVGNDYNKSRFELSLHGEYVIGVEGRKRRIKLLRAKHTGAELKSEKFLPLVFHVIIRKYKIISGLYNNKINRL